MKILLATESYYPNIDGGAVAQYNLMGELKKLGHEPIVIAPGKSFRNYIEEACFIFIGNLYKLLDIFDNDIFTDVCS